MIYPEIEGESLDERRTLNFEHTEQREVGIRYSFYIGSLLKKA